MIFAALIEPLGLTYCLWSSPNFPALVGVVTCPFNNQHPVGS
jgi:hypothetical protein